MTIRWLSGSVGSLAIVVCCRAGALPVQMSPHPVTVSSCNPQRGTATSPGFAPAFYPANRWYWRDAYGLNYYQRPVVNNPTLAIDYTNAGPKTIHAIEFGLVARGTLIAEVRDVGTFSPGIEIKHQFGLNPNVFPIGTALPRCVPLRVTFDDGSKWRNPRLPALNKTL